MNAKNISKHLNAKMRSWLDSITDENVKKTIKENTIITGGALVSLLTGEPVHDYDVYFRTKEACTTVACYYVDKWNEAHPDKSASVVIEEDSMEQIEVESLGHPMMTQVTVPGRVKVLIQSDGVAGENIEKTENDRDLPIITDDAEMEAQVEEESSKKDNYRPVFLSSNAITLSDKIQVVVRFYGDVDEIHKNYDFAHCTCSWSSWNNKVTLPTKALECIINKELYYIGSKYPLCSIIRTRKYIERGYHINAGQYVKMAFQLNDLNLNDIKVLEDQLCGVDSGYFLMMIDALHKKMEETGSSEVDKSYVFDLINRMF